MAYDNPSFFGTLFSSVEEEVDEMLEEIKEDCEPSESFLGMDIAIGGDTCCLVRVINPGTKDQIHEVVRFI